MLPVVPPHPLQHPSAPQTCRRGVHDRLEVFAIARSILVISAAPLRQSFVHGTPVSVSVIAVISFFGFFSFFGRGVDAGFSWGFGVFETSFLDSKRASLICWFDLDRLLGRVDYWKFENLEVLSLRDFCNIEKILEVLMFLFFVIVEN